MRKRELEDKLDIVNFDLHHEQRRREKAQERVQFLADRNKDLLKAIELLADRLAVRQNYMIYSEWEETQVFDIEQLVQDLFIEQENGEVLLEDEARKARLSKPSKGNPEK